MQNKPPSANVSLLMANSKSTIDHEQLTINLSQSVTRLDIRFANFASFCKTETSAG
jgi:hypothetical protein